MLETVRPKLRRQQLGRVRVSGSFETVEDARASLSRLNYRSRNVARKPGEYTEEIINNDVCITVVTWENGQVTWLYDRITRRFKKIE